MKTLYLYFFALLSGTVLTTVASCQKPNNDFAGTWIITNAVNMEGPVDADEVCIGKEITIGPHSITINSSSCLLTSFNNFKIEYESELSRQAAHERFSEKFVTGMFDDNDLKKIRIYKTNYKRKEDEGVGGDNWIGKGDLHIIRASSQKLILFCYGYIISLQKK